MLSSASPCEFCGRRGEIAVTAFDALVPLGPPRIACRFCLGRPHRQKALIGEAVMLRLQDLSSSRTATGRAEELAALLGTLTRERTERTITAAIRVQSHAMAPTELVCAGCGGTVTPSKGGIATWRRSTDGRWSEARIFHGQGCASQLGAAPEPGCWEDLASLGSLDLTRFDEESLGYLTDVEIAWKELQTS